MYKYGLGSVPSWTEEALGLEEGSQRLDPSDPWYIGPGPDAAPVPDAEGAVQDAEGAVKNTAAAARQFLKTPIGLGIAGLLAGLVLTRGKKKKQRHALIGAALGAGAGYMLQRGQG